MQTTIQIMNSLPTVSFAPAKLLRKIKNQNNFEGNNALLNALGPLFEERNKKIFKKVEEKLNQANIHQLDNGFVNYSFFQTASLMRLQKRKVQEVCQPKSKIRKPRLKCPFPVEKFDKWDIEDCEVFYYDYQPDVIAEEIVTYYHVRKHISFVGNNDVVVNIHIGSTAAISDPWALKRVIGLFAPAGQICQMYKRYGTCFAYDRTLNLVVSPQVYLLILLMYWKYRENNIIDLLHHSHLKEFVFGSNMKELWKKLHNNPKAATILCNSKMSHIIFKNIIKFDILDRCGDVEKNPGPVSISKLICKQIIDDEESDKIMFILPNSFTFEYDRRNVTLDGSNYIFTDLKEGRIQNELLGELKFSDVFHVTEKLKGSRILKPDKSETLIRTTRWTNHDDFDPNKRIIINPISKFINYLGGGSIRELILESEGHVVFRNNFTFIPKNILRFRFSKVWYFDSNFPFDLSQKILASVSRQVMTCEQMAQMAANLATVQMMKLDIQNQEDILLSTFTMLFENNYHSFGANQTCKYSPSDVWKALFDLENVFIPTVRTKIDDPKYVLGNPSAVKFNEDFVYSEAYFKKTSSQTLKEYPFAEKTDKEIFEDFRKGLLNIYSEDLKSFNFRMSKMNYATLQDSFIKDLSVEEGFLKFLVEDRLTEVDISKTFIRAAYYALSKTPSEFFNRIIRKLSTFRIDSFYQPGLTKLMKQKDEPLDKLEMFVDRHNKIDYINKNLFNERRIVSLMQTELFTWSKIFGFKINRPIFNNIEYVYELAEIRRIPAKVVNDSDDDSDEEDEEVGFFSRVFEKIKVPFSAGKNFFVNISDSASDIKSLNITAKELSEKFSSVFEASKMDNVFECITKVDFSTVKGTFATLKMIMNAWFTDFVTKICNLFGVDYKQQLDASKMLFYYIIWQNNDSKIVRFLIILDLLTELGITDFVLSILSKIYSGFISLCQPRTVAFEDLLKKFEIQTEEKVKLNKDKIEKHRVKVPEESTESWLDTIIQGLGNATPAMLGVAATALIASLGLPSSKIKNETLGDKIIKSSRNIGYLAIGVAGLPKIFENVLKVLNFVIDYIKSMIITDHKTEYQYLREVQHWLQNSIYMEGVSERLFVRDLDVCFGFMKNYNQMVKLKTKMYTIKDSAIRAEFKSRCEVMSKLYPIVISAVRIMLGQREVFHIQLYSKQVGVGKTDAAHQVITNLKRAFEEQENLLMKTIGLKPYASTLSDADIYPMNDCLKHNDMYYGQHFGYSDEETVMHEMEADTLIQKMQMLSGFPCISQQASINDKGRIFEIKTLVSNTNNPYNKFKGMLKPEALWRRRQLFEVKVKERFLDSAGKINDEKINSEGLNRTLGEHLEITWLNNVEHQPQDPDAVDMSMSQFIQLARTLAVKHFHLEEQRLNTKNLDKSLIRLRWDRLLADIQDTYKEGLTKDANMEGLLKDLDHLKAQYKESVKNSNSKIRPSGLSNLLEDFSNIAEHIQPSTSKGADAGIEEYRKKNKTVGFLDVDKYDYTKYVLTHSEEDGKFIYSIDTSTSNFNVEMQDGPINFKNIKFRKINGKDRIVYISDSIATVEEARFILYNLVDLSTHSSETYVKKAIDLKILKQQGKSEWKHLSNKLHILSCRSLALGARIIKWVSSKLFKFFSETLISGLVLTFTLLAMFFSLSMIGQFLAPKTVAYQTKERSRNPLSLPSSNFPKPVAATLENPDVKLAQMATYSFQIDSKRATMIGMKGSIFLANKHAISITKPTEILVYDPKFGSVDVKHAIKKYQISPKDISEIPGTDNLLINIRGFRPVRSVLSHFITDRDCESDLINFHYIRSQSVLLRQKDKSNFLNSEREWLLTGYDECYPYNYNQTALIEHDNTLQFKSDTKIFEGDSGSLAVHNNDKVSGKFLGTVIAKNKNGGGYIGLITREQIEKAMTKFPKESIIETSQKDSDPIPCHHSLKDVFLYTDEVYQSPILDQSISKSLGFKKSPIFGVFPVETVPAIQDERDSRIVPGSRHFLKVSLNKTNGTKESYFTQEEENFMERYLEAIYVKYVSGLEHVRIYTVNQAITGIRAQGSTSINTKTSAGLPYKLEKGVIGKRPFIQFNEYTQSWQIQNRVYDDVAMATQIYKAGFVPFNHKLEFRKKELVPHSKIEDPKTRTVATGNFVHQIIYNQLFKDMHTMVKNEWNNGNATPFALGVDPERHSTQIVNHLKYTDYVIDFDVKAWEEKMSLKLLLMSAKVKLKLLKDAYNFRGIVLEDVDMLAYGLAVDFTDCEVIFEDVMYRKRSGLLSGHPGTFMENSEVHEMLLGLVCLRILKKSRPQWANIDFIIEHVRSIKAADDIMIAISPLARKFINIDTLIEGYNLLEFEVTSADKQSKMEPKNILNSQFLKQHFRKVGDEYFPIPSLSIVYQLFNWIRDDTSLSIEEQFKVNIQNAFRFLYWRGEEEYESIRSVANIAFKQISYQWTYNYSDMGVVMRQLIQDADFEANRKIPKEEPEFDE